MSDSHNRPCITPWSRGSQGNNIQYRLCLTNNGEASKAQQTFTTKQCAIMNGGKRQERQLFTGTCKRTCKGCKDVCNAEELVLRRINTK